MYLEALAEYHRGRALPALAPGLGLYHAQSDCKRAAQTGRYRRYLVSPGVHPAHATFVIIYALLQCGRLWVLMSLGRHWTTRIIVLPGAPLVASGPYRVLKHPNYFILTAEFALMHGFPL
jgi:hypothetical protein